MLNIYVGNLSYNATDAMLQETFSAYGTVDQAKVLIDRVTGRSRGFGFVEMASEDEGRAAIEGVNGQEMDGRTLVVNEARPKR